jgi:hypothetical protein
LTESRGAIWRRPPRRVTLRAVGRSFTNILQEDEMRTKTFFFGILTSALLALPASAAPVTFGSKLNHEPTPPETCKQSKPGDMCSWVMTIAQANVGHETAPKAGTIAKLRLRSCSAGSFVLQITRTNTAKTTARAITTGPEINYQGSATNCSGGSVIETFTVNVPVRKGDRLAVIATKVGFIYNASGDGTMVFDPPLPDGGPFRAVGNTAGLGSGILLLQAEYAP